MSDLNQYYQARGKCTYAVNSVASKKYEQGCAVDGMLFSNDTLPGVAPYLQKCQTNGCGIAVYNADQLKAQVRRGVARHGARRALVFVCVHGEGG
jgi:hypothetical protein